MLNTCTLIGRLGAKPEVKYTTAGHAVVTVNIAVDRELSKERRDAGEEKQTDWIPVVAWRYLAEWLAQYMDKGCMICVCGRLQVRQYVAEGGSNRRAFEVVADSIKAITWPVDKPDRAPHPAEVES